MADEKEEKPKVVVEKEKPVSRLLWLFIGGAVGALGFLLVRRVLDLDDKSEPQALPPAGYPPPQYPPGYYYPPPPPGAPMPPWWQGRG